MKDRMATLEAENARLRRENEELEALLTETAQTLCEAIETLTYSQLVTRSEADVYHG